MQKKDPELYELMKKEHQCNQNLKQLVAKIRRLNREEKRDQRQQMVQKLQQLLGDLFDIRHQMRMREIVHLEKTTQS